MSVKSVRRSRSALRIAGLIGRHVAFPLGLRTLSGSERSSVATAAGEARFDAWVPRSVPTGFSVVAVDLARFSRDVLTIGLCDRAGRAMEVSQRENWLPLAEELATAGVPFDAVPGLNGVFLMHGKYGGEPIDLSFWNSRRALVFERGKLRIECREVIGRGPGLSALIRFAAAASREFQNNSKAWKPKGFEHEQRRTA
jgi:hypothetical protein